MPISRIPHARQHLTVVELRESNLKADRKAALASRADFRLASMPVSGPGTASAREPFKLRGGVRGAARQPESLQESQADQTLHLSLRLRGVARNAGTRTVP
eukprot:2461242-Rhodomonas_salina.1